MTTSVVSGLDNNTFSIIISEQKKRNGISMLRITIIFVYKQISITCSKTFPNLLEYGSVKENKNVCLRSD